MSLALATISFLNRVPKGLEVPRLLAGRDTQTHSPRILAIGSKVYRPIITASNIANMRLIRLIGHLKKVKI